MADPSAPGARCPFPHGGDGERAVLPAAEPGECPRPHHPAGEGDGSSARWTPPAREAVGSTARRAAPASHLDPDRAEGMAVRAVESRADQRRMEEIGELFVQTLGKKLGYGHPLSDRTGMATFTWTEEAEARLAEVPAFCRELTRWRVEWTAHKQGLGTTITPEVMAVKYEMWGEVSHAIQGREREGLPWTESARRRFARVPEFVQGQVLEAVEGNARHLGATVVDDDVVDRVVAKWGETGDFHEGLYGFR
ncbi:MAG TPA: PCP reductase family protein [Verrucomicrobiae bacterium]|nr:PCP reductase family protein [Verrucomicrobiae bacterium]